MPVSFKSVVGLNGGLGAALISAGLVSSACDAD